VSWGNGWWAGQDLNLGPHPYRVSRAKRRADRRFPRSRATVRGQGMRSNNPPGSAHIRNAVASGKLCQQPAPARRWSCRVGAAAPSSGVTVVRPCIRHFPVRRHHLGLDPPGDRPAGGLRRLWAAVGPDLGPGRGHRRPRRGPARTGLSPTRPRPHPAWTSDSSTWKRCRPGRVEGPVAVVAIPFHGVDGMVDQVGPAWLCSPA
jgi:hypothetical protein